jgi:MFS family permease
LSEALKTETDHPDVSPVAAHHRFLRRVAAAFTYRDFRLLWGGAFSSTVGTWVQKVAQSWLILSIVTAAYGESRVSFFLGLDDFLGQLPILLFTLIGGVIADRYDRRHLLIGSQYVQMATAFTLAALVWFGVVQLWHILALSFVAGTAQAFGGPAYQALIPSLVARRDLPNAIALNSIQFNLARVIGPLIAGVTLALFGTAVCFALNGISFVVVIVALMALSVKHIPPQTRLGMWDEMRGGLRYARSQPAIISLTILGFVTTFLGLPLLTLLPVIASSVFQGSVERYSQMMAFSGAGAVVGALVVAWLGRFRHMGLATLLVQGAFGLLLIAFAASETLWLSNLLLFVTGATLLAVFSFTASLVQLIVPDHLRGRVVSIYMVAFRGGMPLGGLAAGTIASVTSAPTVLAIFGAVLAMVAGYYLVTSHGIREL